MDRSEALSRVGAAQVGHLATVRPDGRPHVVAVTFALVGDSVVTMIDQKPKTTRRLQRLINIEANPEASFLVDHYSDDWTELWWVRIDGQASIHSEDDLWRRAAEALVAKYDQYRGREPEGPAIVLAADRVTSWASTP